jgi:hypothetical protein
VVGSARWSLIGSAGGALAPTLVRPPDFRADSPPVWSRAFSYLLDYRKVVRSPFVSM